MDVTEEAIDVHGSTSVVCANCDADGPAVIGHSSDFAVFDEAVRRWNTRASPVDLPLPLAPFDPWSLPEVDVEYKVRTTGGDLLPSGKFAPDEDGALWFSGYGVPVPLSLIRVWRKV